MPPKLLLQACFEPHKYFLSTVNDRTNQCIAPANHGGQCSQFISKDDAAQVTELTMELIASTDRMQRLQLLQRLAVLRCCSRWHRQKLHGNRQILQQVVARYEQAIEDSPCEVPLKSSPGNLTWAPRTPSSGQGHGYALRPRKVELNSDANKTDDIERPADLLVPYSSCHFGDVESLLVKSITDPKDGYGFVYAFVWPDAPGFVKLGSCKSSVNGRLARWRKCHPNAKLAHCIAVPYRKRAEQLIHRQMSRQRHRMVSCGQCASTHLEWFKMPVDQVKCIMNSWEELLNTWSLYDEDGTVAPVWHQRLGRTKRSVTARRLVGICNAESKACHKEKSRQCVPKQRNMCTAATVGITPMASPPEESTVVRMLLMWAEDWDLITIYFGDFWCTV